MKPSLRLQREREDQEVSHQAAGRTSPLQALHTGAKPWAPPTPASASLASRQERFLQVGFSIIPTPIIRPCKLQIPPCPQTAISPMQLQWKGETQPATIEKQSGE